MRLGVEGLAKNKIQMKLEAQTHLNNERPGLPSEGLKEENPLGLENFEFGEKGEGIAPTDRAVESGNKDICVVENSGSPRCGTLQMPSVFASDDSNFPWLKPCSGPV
ncbi:hypothetical protein VNO80_06637 [Phaseolus coccineus]|uniref:Uncharacterized protein n=1 Tax=Phaseolus coccineus TaxID=3886 RepID=A0AAN9NP54_PHACN